MKDDKEITENPEQMRAIVKRLQWVIRDLPRLKIRKRHHQWCAGFWNENQSPSCASGDIGFYGESPEDAMRKLLKFIMLLDSK